MYQSNVFLPGAYDFTNGTTFQVTSAFVNPSRLATS